jgi:hypothetical protein
MSRPNGDHPGRLPILGQAEPAARRLLLVVPSIGGAAEPPAAVKLPRGAVEVPDDAIAVGDSGTVACFGALFRMLEVIREDQKALVSRLEAAGLLGPP